MVGNRHVWFLESFVPVWLEMAQGLNVAYWQLVSLAGSQVPFSALQVIAAVLMNNRP